MKITCLLLLITFALFSCQAMQVDLGPAIVPLNSSLTLVRTELTPPKPGRLFLILITILTA